MDDQKYLLEKRINISFEIDVTVKDENLFNQAENALLEYLATQPEVFRQFIVFKAYSNLAFELEETSRELYNDYGLEQSGFLFQASAQLDPEHFLFFLDMDSMGFHYESLDSVDEAISIHIRPPRFSDEFGKIQLPFQIPSNFQEIRKSKLFSIFDLKDGGLLNMIFGQGDYGQTSSRNSKEKVFEEDTPENIQFHIDNAFMSAAEAKIEIKSVRISLLQKSPMVREIYKKTISKHFTDFYPDMKLTIMQSSE